jgi:hypothetical protein
MPRPPVKRSKLNIPNQAAKRAANNPLSSSPAARRRQLQEQLASKDVGRIPNDSDDSDLLVVKSRNSRNRRGVARQEIYGSGGVAQGDKVAAHKSPSHKRQRLSSKEVPKPEARLNGIRKSAPLKSGALKPINRLSNSQLIPTSIIKAPANAEPSALGPASLKITRVGSQETPAAERSILGPLKIRKRQPSILRLIDGPDSSILDQDLEDFLPDDESTPLNASRKRKLSTPPRAPSPALPTSSQHDDPTNTEPDLPPPPSSTVSQRRQPLTEIDSDTMAPPRSSSSAPSPIPTNAPSPAKNKANTRKAKQPRSLSTTALQALMPARRQQRTRRDRVAKDRSEFDIPEDSSDPQNDTAENHTGEESYIASPRPTKSGRKPSQPKKLQKKNPPAVRKPNTKIGPAEKGGRGGSISSRGKSRKPSTHSSPPSKSRALPAAKTSSLMQQSEPPSDKPATTSYSRRPSDTDGRGGLSLEEAEGDEDKENRLSASSGGSSKPVRGQGRGYSKLNLDEPAPSPAALDDEHDLSVEISRHSHYEPRGYGAHDASELEPDVRDEQARLAQKFREVDEWEMEFEDVTTFDDDEGVGGGRDMLAR